MFRVGANNLLSGISTHEFVWIYMYVALFMFYIYILVGHAMCESNISLIIYFHDATETIKP